MENADLPEKLPAPARRALAGAGVSSLTQLTSFTQNEIAGLHEVGGDAMELLRTALSEHGLTFKEEK